MRLAAGRVTHDGLCIARAVLEHIHNEIGARTLFATHYHELTALTDDLPGLRNVTVAVDEADNRLAFLYRVVPGAADRSYGVQVARLAGLPATVTRRAEALLARLEGGADGVVPLDHSSADPTPTSILKPEDRPDLARAGGTDRQPLREWPIAYDPGPAPTNGAEADGTLGALNRAGDALDGALLDGAAARVLGDLLALDLSNVTPLQALNVLHAMQANARDSLPWREWLGSLTGSASSVPRSVMDPSGDDPAP